MSSAPPNFPEKRTRVPAADEKSDFAWLAAEIGAIARELGAPAGDAETLEKIVARLAAKLTKRDADNATEFHLSLAEPGDAPVRDFLKKISAEDSPLCALAGTPERFAAGTETPLIFDEAHGALCFLRHFRQEKQIAETIAELSKADAGALPADAAQAAEKRLAAELPHALNEAQKNAVRTMLARQFFVVSGGPGTGKTTLLLRALICFFDRNPNAKILLAAPTGKAARRMKESLGSQIAEIAERAAAGTGHSENVAGTLGEILEKIRKIEPSTLHSLLKMSPSALRRSRAREIAADLLVVDEASMVGRELAARLFASLSAGTRLVLLGDKNQLESVEPGHIFGALCAADSLAACRTELTESRRFRADGFIGKFAAAVVRGARERVAELLASAGTEKTARTSRTFFEENSEIRLSENDFSENAIRRALEALFPERLKRVPADAEPEELLSLLESTRLLTPLRDRKSEFSAERINFLAARLFSHNPRVAAGTAAHFHGRPILITRNSGNFRNGDVGIVLADRNDSARGGGNGEFFAYFRDFSGGGIRRVLAALLPEHETAYAMSIHKAQGSEFSRLAIVFPPAGAANRDFFSRQLLYTAISRFRESATAFFHLIFDRETLLFAVSNRSEPRSLLREKIDEAAGAGNRPPRTQIP